MFGAVPQYFAHADEMRFVVAYHACVGRNRNLAISKCVKSIYRLVGRFVVAHVYDYLRLVGGDIIHTLDFDFPLLVGLYDGFLYGVGGGAERYFGYGERLGIDFRDFRPHLHRSAPQTVVVSAAIGGSSRRKIRQQSELLAAQVRYGSIYKFVEVVRQDFGGQTDGYAFDALCEQ